jgi:hypothetical protein
MGSARYTGAPELSTVVFFKELCSLFPWSLQLLEISLIEEIILYLKKQTTPTKPNRP